MKTTLNPVDRRNLENSLLKEKNSRLTEMVSKAERLLDDDEIDDLPGRKQTNKLINRMKKEISNNENKIKANTSFKTSIAETASVVAANGGGLLFRISSNISGGQPIRIGKPIPGLEKGRRRAMRKAATK